MQFLIVGSVFSYPIWIIKFFPFFMKIDFSPVFGHFLLTSAKTLKRDISRTANPLCLKFWLKIVMYCRIHVNLQIRKIPICARIMARILKKSFFAKMHCQQKNCINSNFQYFNYLEVHMNKICCSNILSKFQLNWTNGFWDIAF